MNFVMKKSLFSHFLCLSAGTWECPDVFEIKAAATKDGSSGDEENEEEETRFVLKANTAQGSACHGGPNNWWAVGQFVPPEELPAAAVASTDGAFKPTSTVQDPAHSHFCKQNASSCCQDRLRTDTEKIQPKNNTVRLCRKSAAMTSTVSAIILTILGSSTHPSPSRPRMEAR